MAVDKTNVIKWPALNLNNNPYARALHDEEMMLWVYPYDDIRWGSMLVVNEYEKAIFMRDGKIYDVFTSGRYLISTLNLPILTDAFNFISGIWGTHHLK